MFNNYHLKKYCADILLNKYPDYEHLIDKIGIVLQSDKDVQFFLQMLADCYEKGYSKCVRDHEGALHKLGYKVTLRK